MSLKNFFKRQPGGSPFGNILRGVGDRLLGNNVFSSIFPAPKKKDSGGENSTPSVSAPVHGGTPASIVGGGFPEPQKDNKKKYYVWGGIAAGVLAVYYFFFRGQSGRKNTRRW